MDDLPFLIFGYKARLAFFEEDMRLAGLLINWDKSDGTLLHRRLHLDFIDVDIAFGIF